MDLANVHKVMWYAKVEDMVGGWCIGTTDITPANGGDIVCDMMTEETARHVVKIHNEWLYKQTHDLYEQEFSQKADSKD